MTQHFIRYNGDQNYCSRCQCSWDRDDDPPVDCIVPLPEPVRTYKKKGCITPQQWQDLKNAVDTGDFSKLL